MNQRNQAITAPKGAVPADLDLLHTSVTKHSGGNMGQPEAPSLSAIYRAAVASGAIREDPAQAACATKLDALLHRILNDNHGGARRGQRPALFGRTKPPAGSGLYIVGEVGRGKTMLMDMFFDALPFPTKRRVHFHAFMQDILHALNTPQLRQKRLADPLAALAERIAQHNRVLCFDEFQLNDMSDAVVNLRVITLLLQAGVHVVMTSNTEPKDLLRHNRQQHRAVAPFIESLTQHLDIVTLNAQRDYRRDRAINELAWLVPHDEKSRAMMDTVFARFSTTPPRPEAIKIGSRQFSVARSGSNIARLSFAELCAERTGTAEFLALTARYPALIIEDIPQLSPDQYDEALRFIRLVDVIYERGTKLFASAAIWPQQIYPEGENVTAFRRTISRLEEMRSKSWHNHIGA